MNVPLRAYQHHKAHFASVLGENDLLDSNEKVMGVVWDGTGYGEDGNVWGGEFFVKEGSSIKRVHHLNYFPHISGNLMAKDPVISCLAASYPELIRTNDNFSKMEWDILVKSLEKPRIFTSSIGRLFDAVGALLDISRENTFEGETALKVQQMAESSSIDSGKCLNAFEGVELVPSLLLKEIRNEKKSRSKEDICLDFHITLVEWISRVAISFNCDQLAFSGGVFQNSLLTSLIRNKLKTSFRLHFHKQLSPNDENISFGQVMLAELEKLENSDNLTKRKYSNHVFSSTR